jgi:hypothetical protein
MRRQVLARLYRAMLVAACLLAPVPPAVRAAETPSIAVFDFELVDTSIQGDASPEELARLKLITDELRARLEASGRYRVVDTAPLGDEIADAGYLRTCNGCDVRLAHEVGAELALVGWVQKVSNLILNINVQIRDVATRELRFAGSVDIRGNTDESWLHGVRYLAKNRLLKTSHR